jgi:hypothetical protein
MARSLLAAHEIPYFVHNGEYASLYPGMQVRLLNVPTIMVPPSAAEFATEMLHAYLAEVRDHLHPRAERSPRHILRMLAEAIFCGWFVRRIGVREARSSTADETTSDA